MKKIYPCVVGLGYVGLPLFVRLKKKFCTVGYDTDENRVKYLLKKKDKNKEFSNKDLTLQNRSTITTNKKKIQDSNFYIVTVPTPVNKKQEPDLKFLKNALTVIGKNLKKDDIVFVESTIYPSVTQNICVPILEKESRLKNNKDFIVGYSSERINPGDKKHSVENIKKVVAVETNKKNILYKVKAIYKTISKKIVLSKLIKEAETSKVIENVQRDLNIALMNEIFLICEKLKINFNEVKKLALTKWNFHNYSPGLVGGHCLPVDPYYLAYIAKKKNYPSNVILSGRKVNNNMKNYIIKKIINILKKNNFNCKILLFGASYKANVADSRNSIPLSVYKVLKKKYSKKIFCIDTFIEPKLAKKNKILHKIGKTKYDYFIPLVSHKNMNFIYKKIFKNNKQVRLIKLIPSG